MRDQRQFLVALLLGFLDAAFHVPDRVEIFVELAAIALPEGALQVSHFRRDRVENAAILLDAREPRLRVGASGVAEQPLEHRARVVLHRQRRRVAPPADGAGVVAGVTLVAGARRLRRLDGHFQRRELGMFPHLLRKNLVHRNAGA